mgnify:CR=1 FL=1
MMRLDKYLADMSIGTRTEGKKLIRQGKVAVDGLIGKNPDIKVDTDTQNVTCNGIAVTYGPGLVGALLVGVNFAKSLAYANKIAMSHACCG